MGQIHPDGGPLAEYRVGPVGVLLQELPLQSQRVIGRVTHAEHPLVPPHQAHAPSNLVGEGLERQALIRCRESARDAVARPLGGLNGEKRVDGFLEPTGEEVLETTVGNVTVARDGDRRLNREPWRDVEALEGVQEEQRPDAVVEVLAPPSEGVELGALGHELREAHPAARGIERPVAQSCFGGGDEFGQHRVRAASSSTSMVRTSSRSWPDKASASWADKSPYVMPMS